MRAAGPRGPSGAFLAPGFYRPSCAGPASGHSKSSHRSLALHTLRVYRHFGCSLVPAPTPPALCRLRTSISSSTPALRSCRAAGGRSGPVFVALLCQHCVDDQIESGRSNPSRDQSYPGAVTPRSAALLAAASSRHQRLLPSAMAGLDLVIHAGCVPAGPLRAIFAPAFTALAAPASRGWPDQVRPWQPLSDGHPRNRRRRRGRAVGVEGLLQRCLQAVQHRLQAQRLVGPTG